LIFQNLTERESQVLELIIEDSGVSVTDLSGRLGVSAVTIRSTLSALADKGVIVRTWGGAAPAFHPAIVERGKANMAAKSRIARRAAELVRDGDTIMVEAGTTTAMIGKYLFGRQNVHVVTNSTLFVPYARANPALEVTMTGGAFRAATESVVGPIALAELARFHVRLAFVGTDGFSCAAGLTTHLVEGAEIVKAMAAAAEQTVVLADSSKYGKSGFVTVLPLEQIDVLVTDDGLSKAAEAEIAELGVEVVRVPSEGKGAKNGN
jgi:DeoR family transcriptional regulator, galactitol utilization operon repressor